MIRCKIAEEETQAPSLFLSPDKRLSPDPRPSHALLSSLVQSLYQVQCDAVIRQQVCRSLMYSLKRYAIQSNVQHTPHPHPLNATCFLCFLPSRFLFPWFLLLLLSFSFSFYICCQKVTPLTPTHPSPSRNSSCLRLGQRKTERKKPKKKKMHLSEPKEK